MGAVTPETCRVALQSINICILLHLVGFLLTLNYDARNHELKNNISRWQRSVVWDWRFVCCNNTDTWLLLKTYTWCVFQACICIVWLAVLRPLRTVPQCDHYGTCRTSYPFLPAPPGKVPSCAKPGSTFCEKIDHYPTWVPNGKVMNHITTCIRRGGINPCILKLDITRRHVISFTAQPFYNMYALSSKLCAPHSLSRRGGDEGKLHHSREPDPDSQIMVWGRNMRIAGALNNIQSVNGEGT